MNKKKTVIIFGGASKVLGHLNPGGVITATQTLLRSPIKNYFNIKIIDISQTSFPVPSIPIRLFKAIGRFIIFFLYLLIYYRNCSVFLFASNKFSFFERSHFCLLARIFKVRSILAERSGHFKDWALATKMSRFWVYQLLRFPSIILCQGLSWKNFYMSIGVPAQKCVIIKNWINLTPYDNFSLQKKDTSSITFLFVGWLNKPKGVWECVDAFKTLLDQGYDSNLIMVGSGKEEDALENWIIEKNLQNKILITGWIISDKILQYYQQSDIFVLPTYTEGFPNVILEAMASGLPVITTPVGSIPDVICEGKNGFLVPPKNVQKIREAMEFCINNPAEMEKIRNNNIHDIKKNHDIYNTWKILAAILEGRNETDIT